MTHTLSKRTIRTTSPPHAHTSEDRAVRFDGRHDAADLAAALRDLALRAYEAVKDSTALNGTNRGPELRELQIALSQFEAEILEQKLDGLVPYVAALRQQVEAKLG